MFHVKPVDPRLLRHARATRGFLAATVLLGLAGAGLVIAQAVFIADLVTGAFQQGRGPGALHGPLLGLVAVTAGRALVAWLTELAAHRASAAVKSELRGRLLAHAAEVPPAAARRTGELAALATRGIDALDDYFARYLPQLGLAVAVPAVVLARIVTADWVSAAIIAGTLPLIPLFMALIGWATQAQTDRQWRALARLSHHFLDVVAGLPTLKVFGRAKAQADAIRRITGDYRRATLRTLRLAFLSSFALELLATLSVALVAVGVGMRLVHGELDLRTGLIVLVLAPEAYLPLRQVGAHYHAAAEGLAAADQVFEVLAQPVRTGGDPLPPSAANGPEVVLDAVAVRHPGRATDSPGPVTARLAPGTVTALSGPSGAGKSSLVSVLLGFTAASTGRVLVDGADLATLDAAAWRARVAWLPQRPRLFAGTVAENVRLARPDATDAEVRAALRDAAALDFADLTTPVGDHGTGLSAGQRQRVALARAFLADRPLLVLDEPTAGLDPATEAVVAAGIARRAADRTVLLVTHRPALLALAERVVRVPGAERASVGAVPAQAGPGAANVAASPDPVPAHTEVRPGVGPAVRAGTGAALAGAAAGPRRPLATASPAAPDAASAGAGGPRASRATSTASSVDPAVTGFRPSAEAGRATVPAASAVPPGEVVARVRPVTPAAVPADAGLASPQAATAPADAVPADAAVAAAAPAPSAVDAVRDAYAVPARPAADAHRDPYAAPARPAADARRDPYAPTPDATTDPRPLFRMRRGAGRFWGAVGLAVLAAGCAVGLMGTSGWLISRASEQPPVLYLMVAVTATRTFGIGRAAFRYAERLLAHDAVLRRLAELRVAVYRRLERLAPAGLGRARGGDLLARVVADVDGVQDRWLRWLMPAVTAGVVGAGSAAFTGWLAPWAGVALAAGLAVAGIGVPAVAGAVTRRAERRLAPARGALTAEVVDLLEGAPELAVAGALPARLARTAEADRVLTRVAGRGAAAAGLGAGLTALLCGLTVVACGWAGAAAVHAGRLGGVALAVVVLVPLAAFEPVAALPQAVRHRQRARHAADRVREVLDQPEPVREPAHPATPPATPFPLTARGLTARHPGQARPALTGLDLDLDAGRRVAVVGASGAGKTTLAQVLLRFLDAEAGACTLGGVDLATLDGDAARRLIGLCAQDAHVFDSTVRENLRLARPTATDAELRAALAAARLDLTTTEAALSPGTASGTPDADAGNAPAPGTGAHPADTPATPDPLDLPVGEHGTRLSGGQRQRLALARALLADFPVLVLDEPAEHLDTATADALTADLLAAVEGRAVLLITHRLAPLAVPGAVDEIVVLDGGRVVQRGTYAELGAVPGPFRGALERERAADAAADQVNQADQADQAREAVQAASSSRSMTRATPSSSLAAVR
jgi:ATP-binding cassette subfamily C protein CydCD